MKHIYKKLLIVLLACLCAFSLVACAGGITSQEAEETVLDFLAAIATEDYALAQSLLHPVKDVDLEVFFDDLEREEGVDFQEGIEIVRYIGFSSSLFDSTVGGARYTITMRVKIGGEDAERLCRSVGEETLAGLAGQLAASGSREEADDRTAAVVRLFPIR